MSGEFEAAHRSVCELVRDYETHRDAFLSSDYSEAQARQDWIDKFLHSLGWDVWHTEQKNPYQQEVKVERNVDVGGVAQRRADYALYVAPNFRDVRLFIEAKRPRVPLASADNYFQAIRYGWNSQTPLAVLISFEELHIVDCRYKPNIDSALGFGVRKYHFSDYPNADKFAEIFYLISRLAVAEDSLERFAETLEKRRGASKQRGLFKGGYQALDVSFLNELEAHRDALARSFKNENPDLDGEVLTELTQRVLDRLVFLRFLEDKQIETRFKVAEFGNKGTVWEDFVAASRRLDAIYNGIVFKEHLLLDKPGRLVIDDKVFGDICEDLSHVNSPYDFNVIPIHILGSIYERFLGKVIVTTAKRAKLEEKAEIRKAGGVYYTPEYIVRYITAATLGPLVDDKSPEKVSDLRVIDIACGSGSFLLGAFDYLIQHQGRWLNNNKDKAKEGDFVQDADGRFHVSLKKKREILLKNIFGVDIDPQAVEVAQLSLYLKLLEEETPATARSYQLELHETILPSLGANVICGNSLVGTDVLSRDLLADDDGKHWNAMDFETRFPNAVHGFDAVIGNPPYVRPHNILSEMKEYLWRHYSTFTHKSDLYCAFVERGERLLKDGGRLGYILSHGWLRLDSFQALRQFVLKCFQIEQLVELPYKVFTDAQVETGIVILRRYGKPTRRLKNIKVLEGRPTTKEAQFEQVNSIPQGAFENTFQNVYDLSISPETDAVKNIMRKGPEIGKVFDICFGLKTGDDERFLHHEQGKHREDKPLLRGENVKRYATNFAGEYVWYVPDRMTAHRRTARPGNAARFEQPKVLIKDTSTDFAGTYDPDHYYVKDVLIAIPKQDQQTRLDLRFLTALINSKALHFYYRSTFKTLHVQAGELASLPLPDFSAWTKTDWRSHDTVVEMVDELLNCRKRAATALTDRDVTYYESRFRDIDSKVDHEIFRLYRLTSEHIAVIEAHHKAQ